MNKVVLGTALLCLASTAVLAQAPTASTLITNADVEKVLKDSTGDHTIRTMEMGQGYQMSIAVVSRGPSNAPAPAPSAAQQAQQAAAAKQPACGLSAAPAGAKLGPKGMIQHDSTAET